MLHSTPREDTLMGCWLSGAQDQLLRAACHCWGVIQAATSSNLSLPHLELNLVLFAVLPPNRPAVLVAEVAPLQQHQQLAAQDHAL